MNSPIFLIETTMEHSDYRNFMYISTFLKNKLMLPFIALLSLAGSLLINLTDGPINLTGAILTFLFLFSLAIGVICLKVEGKNKQRIKTDNTGTFGSTAILKFYSDYVVMENPVLNSTGTLYYNQFFQLLESKDYFIFYINANQASLLRKKDIASVPEFRNFIVAKLSGRYRTI